MPVILPCAFSLPATGSMHVEAHKICAFHCFKKSKPCVYLPAFFRCCIVMPRRCWLSWLRARRRIDGDTVLMQDVYGVTVMVGYQFAMRWMNAHVFYVKRRSPLAKRILTTTMAMPLNHPNLATDIVEKVRHLTRTGHSPCISLPSCPVHCACSVLHAPFSLQKKRPSGSKEV